MNIKQLIRPKQNWLSTPVYLYVDISSDLFFVSLLPDINIVSGWLMFHVLIWSPTSEITIYI